MSRRTRFSFTITILAAFALVFLVAVGLVVAGYRATGAAAALTTAERSLRQAADTAAANTLALIRPVLILSAVLPEFAPLVEGAEPGARDTAALLALLAAEPAVHAVSMGHPDGTLRQVLRVEMLSGTGVPTLPAAARYALREGAPAAADVRWTPLDAGHRPLGSLLKPGADADIRQTQWYLQAVDETVHVSTLYDLPLLGRPGLSVSRQVPGSRAVLSLDMTLDALAQILERQRASPRSVLFLFTEDGILLAHQNPDIATAKLGGEAGDGIRTSWTTLAAAADPLLHQVWARYAQSQLPAGQTREVATPDGPVLVRLTDVEGMTQPRVLVAVAAPLSDFTATIDDAVTQGTLYAAIALIGGLVAIGLLAWRVAAPLTTLTREAEAIRRLEFEAPMQVNSRITEIARLSDAMGGMKSALRLFAVYVPRDLVGKLLQDGEAARIGGERRRLTVLFSDVIDFTTLAEGLEPEELMRITSAYFQAVTEELLRNRATIDKYIGDAVMALWNAPRDDPQHARNACLAALWTRHVTERLSEQFAARGWPRLRTCFGLHTGDAVVGNVGSSDRLSYTAIGSMVNLASRIEGMNRFYGSHILISEATRSAAGALFVTRPVDLVLAKGVSQPLDMHELLGLSVIALPAEEALRPDAAVLRGLSAWQAMIGHYRGGRFEAAGASLAEAGDPGRDPLLALYAQRIGQLRAQPPEGGWSPVLRFTSK